MTCEGAHITHPGLLPRLRRDAAPIAADCFELELLDRPASGAIA